MPKVVQVWWKAIRPFSFTASVTPVVVGTAMAAYDGHFNLLLALLTLIGSVSIHAGTNLVNDYYDHVKGADTATSLGPSGVIQRGLLTPQQVLIGGIVAFALGAVIGLYLVSVTGPFIFWLGVFSIAAGFFYTAGPTALAYIGLGEVTVFIFMGPIMVLGSYYVLAQQIDWPVILVSLPVGFLVAAILHANNLRDLEDDRRLGKKTLATILGREIANWEYHALVGGTYVVLAVLILLRVVPWTVLLAGLTIPNAWRLTQRVAHNVEPRALNAVIRRTADLHARVGFLVAAGFVVAMFLPK